MSHIVYPPEVQAELNKLMKIFQKILDSQNFILLFSKHAQRINRIKLSDIDISYEAGEFGYEGFPIIHFSFETDTIYNTKNISIDAILKNDFDPKEDTFIEDFYNYYIEWDKFEGALIERKYTYSAFEFLEFLHNNISHQVDIPQELIITLILDFHFFEPLQHELTNLQTIGKMLWENMKDNKL